jgi:hypothetical protein
MNSLKKFNEMNMPSREDTSILEDINHIFASLIEDYDPQISEFTTGVTTLTFKKLDHIEGTIEEYHDAIEKQLHLVSSIMECVDKLKIHIPDLAVRFDSGCKSYLNESKKTFRIYLGSKECAEVITRMI